MELRLYLDILRRRWLLVVALPLLVALLSAGVALARPARYGTATRLLVTRGDAPAGSAAGLTDLREDKTAQDLPAIVSGATFRHDLAAELARRGQPVDETNLAGAIQAGNQEHVVTLAVGAARPEQAEAIAQSTIDLIRRNGLRYWGEPGVTPERPGLNVAVLDPPGSAVQLSSARSIALDVALRAVLALAAAIALAFGLHYLDGRRPTAGNSLQTKNQGSRIKDQVARTVESREHISDS